MDATLESSAVRDAPNAAHGFIAAFFEELRRGGVEHVCVSPGSRSTPLAVAAMRCAGLRCWSQLDERSAGFFALGLALATDRPVALVCTSGTAAANYLPAVIEAHYAHVPLLVLSADRPPELRDWGAGQTVDQIGLYGRHVRRFVELPPLGASSGDDALLRYARGLASRSIADATGIDPGPVHLNWPLREPLEPYKDEAAPVTAAHPLALDGRSGRAYAPARRGVLRANAAQLGDLSELLARYERGVIACGPLAPDERCSAAIAELGRRAGWPVLADPTSQLRRGAYCADAPIIASADLLLRDAGFASAQRADVVLRLGGPPTSKAQRLWIEATHPEHLVLVAPTGDWNDPSHQASEVLRLDPTELCEDLAPAIDETLGKARESAWLAEFRAADEAVSDAVARAIDSEPALFEPRAIRELAALLPAGTALHVSNSMPVRDLDAFLPRADRALHVYCNRGANGIDGVTSSAIGAAAARDVKGAPVVLLIGDLAFLHDLGGLLAARRYDISLTIVVLNNDGGGIFSFLPIADHTDSLEFEEFFRTPHGLDLAHAAALFGARHERIDSWADFRVAVGRSLTTRGVDIIELPIDPDANLAHWRGLVDVAANAVARVRAASK